MDLVGVQYQPYAAQNLRYSSGRVGESLQNPYLEISGCVFLSPSTVNGDAPVNSSNVNTPRLHQSTVYWHAIQTMSMKTRRKLTYEIMSSITTLHYFWCHVFNRSAERIGSFILNHSCVSSSARRLPLISYGIIRSKLFTQSKIS